MAQQQVVFKEPSSWSFLLVQSALAALGIGLVHWLKIPRDQIAWIVDGPATLKAAESFVPLLIFAWLATFPPILEIPFMREIYNRILESPFGAFITDGSIFSLASVSLLAGFGEELVFRGVIQNKIGLIAGAVVFGLFHCISISYFLIATLIGAYLGYVFVWSGHNLFPPMLIHALYDFVVLFLLRRQFNK